MSVPKKQLIHDDVTLTAMEICRTLIWLAWLRRIMQKQPARRRQDVLH